MKSLRAIETDGSTQDHQATQHRPNDPIPNWYVQYAAALREAPGSAEPPLREELFCARFHELERRILTTPAQSMEGAIRQIQILAADLDSCGADPEQFGEEGLKAFLRHLWMALFGVLSHTLPEMPDVEDDPHYNLMSPGAEGSAFTLFRSLQAVMK
jgi:hypothetical protein